MIDAWLSEQLRLGVLSRRSLHKLVVLLNGIFRRARRVWRLSGNPVGDVERPSVPRRTGLDVYSPEEVHALARAADNEQDAAVYLTAALTGLRLGELLALRWREVDFSAQTLRVVASYTAGRLGTPKSGHGRAVPMVDQVASTLARLADRLSFTDAGDLVFVGVSGTFLDGSALRRCYKRARDAAGLRPLRFHDLRHFRQRGDPFRRSARGSGMAWPLRLLDHADLHALQASRRRRSSSRRRIL